MPRALSAPLATDPPQLPALAILGAEDHTDAFVLASLEVERAPACDCCATLHDHIVAAVGSVLFFDDDPNRLATFFRRGGVTLRQLAAAIILYGRPRVDLYHHV